jgi:hypothetical protein
VGRRAGGFEQRRATGFRRWWADMCPPSAGFGWGLLQPTMGGSSLNQQWAGPPSTSDAPSGILLLDAPSGGLLQDVTASGRQRWWAMAAAAGG